MWIISGELVLALGEGTERPRNLLATLTHTYNAQALGQVTDTHRVTKKRTQDLCLEKKTALAIYCSVNFHEVLTASSDHLFSFSWGRRKYTEGYFSLFVGRNGEKMRKEEDEISFLLQVLSVFINSRFIQSLGSSQAEE